MSQRECVDSVHFWAVIDDGDDEGSESWDGPFHGQAAAVARVEEATGEVLSTS